jgi:hypothetical protein
MAKFEYTRLQADNESHVYERVDDIFDISILRAEEGLVIDAYDKDEIDLVGTLTVDEPAPACGGEEHP